MSNEVKVDAESIKKSAEDLVELIKLRTFPFGMKLFENVDDITAVSIKDEIRSSLKNYEPRVELIDVNVDPNFDENQFDVLITYRIIGVDIPPSQLEFALLPSR